MSLLIDTVKFLGAVFDDSTTGGGCCFFVGWIVIWDEWGTTVTDDGWVVGVVPILDFSSMSERVGVTCAVLLELLFV